jgi:non-canonical (house-cleaning) NTP pyrophosphatase
MAVVNAKGNFGIGSTLSAPLSRKFLKLVNSGIELGKVTDIISKQKDTKHKGGYFGFVSDNLITREKGYIDGVVMALVRFKKTKYF